MHFRPQWMKWRNAVQQEAEKAETTGGYRSSADTCGGSCLGLSSDLTYWLWNVHRFWSPSQFRLATCKIEGKINTYFIGLVSELNEMIQEVLLLWHRAYLTLSWRPLLAALFLQGWVQASAPPSFPGKSSGFSREIFGVFPLCTSRTLYVYPSR